MILGEERDFLEEKSKSNVSIEASSTSEKEAEQTRKTRQSFSFSSFQPFGLNSISGSSSEEGGISFQRIRMGPEDSPVTQQRQVVSPSNQAGTRPRLTLNELNFEGFQFRQPFQSPVPQAKTPTSTGNSFSSFQRASPVATTRPAPTFQSPSSSVNFPNFQQNQAVIQPQRSRPTTINLPTNRDPRRRNRIRQELISEGTRFVNVQNFQPSTSTARTTPRRLRQRFRTVTSPTTRTPETRLSVSPTPSFVRKFPAPVQNSITKTVRTSKQEEVRTALSNKINDDDNDQLIQNCLKEAIKHAREIEELENRTSLHIEYAQEKQLEINYLEEKLEALKNDSMENDNIIKDLESQNRNMTTLLQQKEKSIVKLKDDIINLEKSFQKEETRKHKTITGLNKKLESVESDLKQARHSLAKTVNEAKEKEVELQDTQGQLIKLRNEKKNLLKIVQQLAEIGNPSLNFNTFALVEKVNDDYESSSDYEYSEEPEDYQEEYENSVQENDVEPKLKEKSDTLEEAYFDVDTSEPEGSGV